MVDVAKDVGTVCRAGQFVKELRTVGTCPLLNSLTQKNIIAALTIELREHLAHRCLGPLVFVMNVRLEHGDLSQVRHGAALGHSPRSNHLPMHVRSPRIPARDNQDWPKPEV